MYLCAEPAPQKAYIRLNPTSVVTMTGGTNAPHAANKCLNVLLESSIIKLAPSMPSICQRLLTAFLGCPSQVTRYVPIALFLFIVLSITNQIDRIKFIKVILRACTLAIEFTT